MHDVLLIDHGDDGLASSIARCLLLDGRFRPHCLTQSPASMLARSRRTTVTVCDLSDGPALLDAVERHAEGHPIDVIMPIQESMIELVDELDTDLSRFGAVAPHPTADACALADDKGECKKLLDEAAVPVALGWPLSEVETARADVAAFDHPLLLKPVAGYGGGGISYFHNGPELLEGLDGGTLEPDGPPSDWIVEEYLEGHDASASFMAFEGELVSVAIKRTLAEQSKSYKSAGVLSEYFQDESITEMTRRFVEATKWSGPGHLDLRVGVDDRTVVLEVNPRFWQSVAGPAALGVNYPAMACLLAMGEGVGRVESPTGLWLDTSLVTQNWSNLRPLRHHSRQSLRAIRPGVMRGDPRLELQMLLVHSRRQLKARARRLLPTAS